MSIFCAVASTTLCQDTSTKCNVICFPEKQLESLFTLNSSVTFFSLLLEFESNASTQTAAPLHCSELIWQVHWQNHLSTIIKCNMPPSRRALQCYHWKMLQPDEGIMALGRMLWGLAKASGVNRLVLLCVVLNGRYIAQCWRFNSIMVTKVISYPEGSFLCGNFSYNCDTVYTATFWICVILTVYTQIHHKKGDAKISNILISTQEDKRSKG